MNIAIPRQNDSVATCFEVSKQFDIIDVENNQILSSKTIEIHGSEGFQRVRLLRLYEVHVLICSGIKRFYSDQLQSIGILVISNVNTSVTNAIESYISGQLQSDQMQQNQSKVDRIVSHEELVSWTKDLFIRNNYQILPQKTNESLLVDFVAHIQCPICNKNIEVAVCCGAQIYRADQEIMEFHYNTKTRYKSRVYVYLTDPQIVKSCDDYGITFISPEMTNINSQNSRIPIIQKPIEGHEKAFGIINSI